MNNTDKEIKAETDQEIVDRISSGDYAVIQSIYHLYYPQIEKLVVQNNGSEEEAQDVFQEAILVLYERITKGDFLLKSRLQTFLYAVCRRMWLKQISRGQTSYMISDISDFEETLIQDDDLKNHEEEERQFQQMEDALEKLGEPCKSLLTEFYVKGKTMLEISEQFGYTNANNAKTQKYKCLQRLKKFYFES